MENIKKYSDFINEGKIQEKEGISPAIYKDLEEYFAGEQPEHLSENIFTKTMMIFKDPN